MGWVGEQGQRTYESAQRPGLVRDKRTAYEVRFLGRVPKTIGTSVYDPLLFAGAIDATGRVRDGL